MMPFDIFFFIATLGVLSRVTALSVNEPVHFKFQMSMRDASKNKQKERWLQILGASCLQISA